VVHNIAYLRFIEIARTLLAEQLGMGLTQMAKTSATRSSCGQKSTTVARRNSATSC
jgi:acyl-CoA thioesterase FadM